MRWTHWCEMTFCLRLCLACHESGVRWEWWRLGCARLRGGAESDCRVRAPGTPLARLPLLVQIRAIASLFFLHQLSLPGTQLHHITPPTKMKTTAVLATATLAGLATAGPLAYGLCQAGEPSPGPSVVVHPLVVDFLSGYLAQAALRPKWPATAGPVPCSGPSPPERASPPRSSPATARSGPARPPAGLPSSRPSEVSTYHQKMAAKPSIIRGVLTSEHRVVARVCRHKAHARRYLVSGCMQCRL